VGQRRGGNQRRNHIACRPLFMQVGQLKRDAHAWLAKRIEYDHKVPLGSARCTAQFLQLACACVGRQELSKPGIYGFPAPSPATVSTGAYHHDALAPRFGLEGIDGLDPKDPKLRDKRVPVVAHVQGVAPSLIFHVFQQPEHGLGPDGIHYCAAGKPNLPNVT
jgi:hypothetical protein